MKAKRPLLGLSASLLVHGLAAAAALWLVARAPSEPILVVELGEAIRVGERAPGPAAPRAEPPHHPAGRAPRRSVSPPPPAPNSPAPAWAWSLPAPDPGVIEALTVPVPAASAPAAPVVGERSRGDGGGATFGTADGGIVGGAPLAMRAPWTGGSGAGSGRAGEGGGLPAELGRYLAELRRRIQEALEYPLAARRRGLGGTVQLEIEVLPSGKVAEVVVRDSSSHAVLDQAAVETVTRLDPVAFPLGVPPRPVRVRLPIVFELR